jgi:hypothetical protein
MNDLSHRTIRIMAMLVAMGAIVHAAGGGSPALKSGR